MKIALAALMLTLPMAAQAGDPCPIPIRVHDLGVPDWLDREALLADLETRKSWIGIQYAYGAEGLSLTAVHDASPAQQAGLRVGDLLQTVAGHPVGPMAQTEAAFDAITPGATVPLSLSRPDQGPFTTSLTVDYTDPVPLGMVLALNEQDCRNATLTEDGPSEREAILAELFYANHAFRCDDSHIVLQDRAPRYDVQDVYVVRGRRRILITMPYWGSHCLPVSTLDGAAYSNRALVAAIDQVIAPYVQDRHNNP